MPEPEFTDFEQLWIRACAVYPVLRWPLTCHIGRNLSIRLGVPEPDLDAHVPIARHPWFRQGYIPDDARDGLVSGLSAQQRRLVAGIYRDLLDTPEARQEVRDQGFEPVEDRIFTQFLLGERPGRTETLVNDRLKAWQSSQWLRWLDARAALVLMAAALLAGLAGTSVAWLVDEDRIKGAVTGRTALPVMVSLPGGTFLMGSPETEDQRDDDEGPQREVTVPGFALARTEITVGQYQAFETATGYQRTGSCFTWDRAKRTSEVVADQANWLGFEQGSDHPVVCVSWQDARAYVDWLNQVDPAGGYRLPTEAEWEYAARAQTQSAFFWGEVARDSLSLTCSYGNGADLTLQISGEGGQGWRYSECEDGNPFTAPTASYLPNGFGLYDMSGNVWEWVEDCWHGSYQGAPTDGSAWHSAQDGDCSRRVVRGGSWNYVPGILRSANRDWNEPENRTVILGFRPARTLFTP